MENAANHSPTREMSLLYHLQILLCSRSSQNSKNLLEIWLGFRTCIRLLMVASAETHGVTSAAGQKQRTISLCACGPA